MEANAVVKQKLGDGLISNSKREQEIEGSRLKDVYEKVRANITKYGGVDGS